MQAKQRPWRDSQWRLLGNWEPKMFLYRRGDGTFVDVERLWEQGHDDQAIARMRDLGINVSHIHFHKGYGLPFEKDSIGEAREWAQRLHHAGIKVGVYIGCTMFTETFDAALLEQMSARGQGEGWSPAQYFRRFWCWNNPHALRYYKDLVRDAVGEIRADVLHFDSGFAFSHNQLCQCEHCHAAFKQFVQVEIPEIVSAAGYTEAQQLAPPPAGNLPYLASVQQMRDPGDVAWTLFHAQAGTRAIRTLSAYARELSADLSFFYNGANLAGISPYSRPNMEIQALEYVDATAVEDDIENPIGVTADGMPISRFRAYKAGTRRNTRVYYYTSGTRYDARLPLAEAAAFNFACLGMVELAMQVNRRIKNDHERQFLRYLVDHEDNFLDRQQWHQIAVVRHHQSMLLNPFPCSLSPYVIEQMLFERHEAFGIIGGDELVTGRRLDDFEGLILPDCKCVSDTELTQIERFLARGGWILSLGNTGTATELNQYRPKWGLARFLGQDNWRERTDFYEEVAGASTAEQQTAANIKPVVAAVGKGRIAHVPTIDFDLPDEATLNRFNGFPWYYHPYWRRPNNAAVILTLLDDLRGQPRVTYDLPRHVALECYRIASGWRVHFVNFTPQSQQAPFELRITLDEHPRTAPQACWHAPDVETDLATTLLGRVVTVRCPGVDVLGTLTLMLR